MCPPSSTFKKRNIIFMFEDASNIIYYLFSKFNTNRLYFKMKRLKLAPNTTTTVYSLWPYWYEYGIWQYHFNKYLRPWYYYKPVIYLPIPCHNTTGVVSFSLRTPFKPTKKHKSNVNELEIIFKNWLCRSIIVKWK